VLFLQGQELHIGSHQRTERLKMYVPAPCKNLIVLTRRAEGQTPGGCWMSLGLLHFSALCSFEHCTPLKPGHADSSRSNSTCPW